ncbi:MAG: adenosine kinase [Candidatus Sericytochromatia bacterium]|nr:adenosine kinase [Candidatus Sericytochromatia bacterium]
MSKTLDVLAICNVLKDIVIKVSEAELAELGVAKGMMHLVSEEQQQQILNRFENHEKTLEMGGSGPNMMRTLALLGQKVSQAGMVGEDLNGERYRQRVEQLGILNNIRQSPLGATGTSIVLITPDGDRTMNTCLGMSRCYTAKDIPDADIARSRYLVVTGYQWDTDNQIEAINHAIRVARQHNTRIVFDLADPFCVKRHRETFLNILEEYVDIVFCNRNEAQMLTERDVEGSLEALAGLVDTVILKTGAKGSWIRQGDEACFVPCNPVDVVDTTAAGDMYAGGFLYGLLNGYSLKDAGQIATFCAETVIQHVGAHVPDNLHELLQQHLKKMQIQSPSALLTQA